MNDFCKICNKRCVSVTKHVFHQHGLRKNEYYDKFYSKSLSDGQCKMCGRPTRFVSLSHGYNRYCSDICSSTDPSKNLKISNSVKSPSCQTKTKETCIKKYGTEYSFNVDEFKQKSKNTLLKKFGVDHYSKSTEFKDYQKSYFKKTYGFENPGQVPSIKDRIKKTFLEKYGHESHFSSNEIKKKILEYNRRVYGVDYKFQSEEFRLNAMYNGRYKIKTYKTSFGDEVKFQTRPELRFIKTCESSGFRVLNGDKINYTFNKKNRVYFCDLKVFENGKWRLVEIKQKHKWWFNDLYSGKIKAKARAAIEFSKKLNYLPYKIKFI